MIAGAQLSINFILFVPCIVGNQFTTPTNKMHNTDPYLYLYYYYYYYYYYLLQLGFTR